MMKVLVDCETTGLLAPSTAPISQQPYITEIFCLKIDDEFNIVDKLYSLVKPPIPLSAEVIKITGITDAMLKDAPTFMEVYPFLSEFFFGCDTFVAHNASFDAQDIYYELCRINKQYMFPWPPKHHCTVELSMPLKGHRLKLTQLHELATGKPHDEGAHRAEADVMALYRSYKWLME